MLVENCDFFHTQLAFYAPITGDPVEILPQYFVWKTWVVGIPWAEKGLRSDGFITACIRIRRTD